MDPNAQIAKIIELQRQMGRTLHGAYPEPLRRLDLTVAQMKILYLLGRRGPSAVGQIAEQLEVAQPSATRTLNRLVRQGLVERFEHPDDRRVSMHRLALSGQALLDQLQQGRRNRLDAALRRLSAAKLAQVVAAFESLVLALEEVAPSESAAGHNGLAAGSISTWSREGI